MIDVSLNLHLGLSEDYKIDKFDAYQLYDYLGKFTKNRIKMSPLLLMYYVDENGDFTKSSKKRDKVVNDIFGRMNRSDQFEVLEYIQNQ